MEENYLDSVKRQFLYYRSLGQKTFNQLTDDDLFWQFNEASNSIAVIVNHMSGNMKSRWTNFLEEDGEKAWRNRDREFESILKSRNDVQQAWNEGWACLFKALESVNEENFGQEVFIRNMGHTILEAINRQLTHYAYHVGQIVYIGRMIKGDAWVSLSIPKGKSVQYNQAKFAEPKRTQHFTDEFLDNDDKKI